MTESTSPTAFMQVWKTHIAEISEWAQKNFGNTPVPNIAGDRRISFGDRTATEFAFAELDFLAPFMGIAEELGEWSAAVEDADVNDAIGDIAIYFCDFLGRIDRQLIAVKGEGLDFDYIANRVLECKPLGEHGADVMASYGNLAHVMLKRFQRIRGMEDYGWFLIALHDAIARFMWTLQWLGADNEDYGGDASIEITLAKVWENIVKKRDWNAERAKAAESTKAGDDSQFVLTTFPTREQLQREQRGIGPFDD